jgi:hypothetical protein
MPLVAIRTTRMPPPRQIYSSSLSRRDRWWGKPRRRGSGVMRQLLARLSMAAVLAMTLALFVLPRFGA